MDARVEKRNRGLLPVYKTAGASQQHSFRSPSAAACATPLLVGTPAGAGVKPAPAGATGETPQTHQQRSLHATGSRRARGDVSKNRTDDAAATGPPAATQYKHTATALVAPSQAVRAHSRAARPYKNSNLIPPPTGAPGRGKLAECIPERRSRGTLQATNSAAFLSAHAFRSKFRSLHERATVVNGGKPQVGLRARARDAPSSTENRQAAAASVWTGGDSKLPSHPFRGKAAVHTLARWPGPPAAGNAPSGMRSLRVESLTSRNSPPAGISAASAVPPSVHAGSLLFGSPCASSGSPLSATEPSEGSCGSFCKPFVCSVAAASSLPPASVKQPGSGQNSLTPTKIPATLKNDASVCPLSAAQASRKASAIEAAQDTARRAPKTRARVGSMARVPASQEKNAGDKQQLGKEGTLQASVPAAPPLPQVSEESVAPRAAGLPGPMKPALVVTAKTAKHPTQAGFSATPKIVRGGTARNMVGGTPAAGSTDSLSAQPHPWAPLDYAYDVRKGLFSTCAVYSASVASSSLSLASDTSSAPSSHAAARTTPDDASPAAKSAPRRAGSSLRSILRRPTATALPSAAKRASLLKRPRRNARFAVSEDTDQRTPARLYELEDAQPPEPATESDFASSVSESDEVAFAALGESPAEQAMGWLSVGVYFPAHWWRATRNRVRLTRALLERWHVDTLAKCDEEQRQEIDVLAASTEAVETRVRNVLTKELQDLIRPDWVIYSTDTLVKRMLNMPAVAEARAGTSAKKTPDSDVPLWKGPSAQSVFGDRLLMLMETPYSILGVYARRTWAASLPLAIAEPIFQAAEAERQREEAAARRLRYKADDLRKRFLLGAKNVLSQQTPYSAAKATTARRATVSHVSRSWSQRDSEKTGQAEKAAELLPSAGTTTAYGQLSARGAGEPGAVKKASVGGAERRAPHSYAEKLTRTRARDMVADSHCACKGLLASEVAACLGVQPAHCPFPLEALKPFPPHGYGKAPVEAEDVRIFSQLEDFLLLNQVPIKRPPGDVRHTPLMSTIRRPTVTRLEESTVKRKTSDGISQEADTVTGAATEQPRGVEEMETQEDSAGDESSESATSVLYDAGERDGSQPCRDCTAVYEETCRQEPKACRDLWTCPCRPQVEDAHGQDVTVDVLESEQKSPREMCTDPVSLRFHAGAPAGLDNVLSARQEARDEPDDASGSPVTEHAKSPRLQSLQSFSEDAVAPGAAAASDRLYTLLSSHLQRYTAPTPTLHYASGGHATAEVSRMERNTVGASPRTLSSGTPGQLTDRRSLPWRLQQEQAAAPAAILPYYDSRVRWKPQALCRRLKRQAGNRLLKQEDVKVSEFWKLHFKDDGTSVWSYEGLQCEPVGVSQTDVSDVLTVRLQ